jgi:hypothetical protein
VAVGDPVGSGRATTSPRDPVTSHGTALGPHPLDIGRGDVTISARITVPDRPTSGLGDVLAAFDPAERRGFSLGFLDASPTGNHGNDRELFFGLDAGTTPVWSDLGKPGPDAIMVAGLAVLDGLLYAATWEGPPSDRGHVYRLDPDGWQDCGSPWDCNAVTRLAIHGGRLLAGVSRLRGGGSGLPDSANTNPGGHVLRYGGGTSWTDLGQLDGADSVAGLIPFGGDLYAIPMYSEGLFRYAEGAGWEPCGSPGRRLLALGVHDGFLYGAGNDHLDVRSAIAQTAAGIVVPQRAAEGGGGVFRYDGGTRWTSLGLQPDTTQVYSIETYDGAIHIGTWPNGIVYRGTREGGWESRGNVAGETEVMNLLAFNGMLFAGTLPLATVARLDGDGWTEVGRVDETPDVRYRRAASMAVHRGEVVVGSLPSGRVHAMRVGQSVSTGRAVAPGPHDVTAIRRGPTVELYVDGALVAVGTDPDGRVLDLGTLPELTIGGGPRARFAGSVLDVEVRPGAITPREVARRASHAAGGA